jgi:hypothetical protein
MLDATDVHASVIVTGLPFADAGPAKAKSATDVNIKVPTMDRITERFKMSSQRATGPPASERTAPVRCDFRNACRGTTQLD